MAPRKLFVQIVALFLGVILLALVLATWLASTSVHQSFLAQTAASLEARARIVMLDLPEMFSPKQAAALNELCKALGRLSGDRITVILPSGAVIGDSEEDPEKMDNHGDLPDVREALAGRVGQAIRHDHIGRRDQAYVAVPVVAGGKVVGIVRASASLASVDQVLRRVYSRIAVAGAVIALLSVLLSYRLTRRITRTLHHVIAGSRRFAEGDFESRALVPGAAELGELASAMKAMAKRLQERIQTLKRQRNELDAVLSSMAEGVLAVDKHERIISLNQAAAGLFSVTTDAARGRDISEVVRNPKLQVCVTRKLANPEPFSDEILLTSPVERNLRVSATDLRDDEGRAIGVLLVLEDVTELRRLERMRSDFIANVSHEIQTPVTSIKGYAETLLGEARGMPEQLQRFLEIIVRQSDRLSALIDDILSLASLERAEAAKDVPLEEVRVSAVIAAATQVCTPKARNKNLRFVTCCDEDIEIRASAPLLEQALVNMLDNAVKYSDPELLRFQTGATPENEIRIEVTRTAETVSISVRDFGLGIAPEHLPRIFERFYRADRSRSRALGGTGLGLAIVKHIVSLHSGRVAAESAPGKGSCFTIYLPAVRALDTPFP